MTDLELLHGTGQNVLEEGVFVFNGGGSKPWR
jgi:hypothetical protein